MSELRLSDIMSACVHAIEDAQEVLDVAITNAIHSHFEAGITTERERIIKLLEEHLDGGLMFAEDWNTPGKEIAYTLFKGDIIALIKEGK